ncbi:MAG: hypothetical protein Q8M24_24830 [Pseudolabrys sp.]|nr:hypothetical protein [Pseudolabrys sp.]
MPIFSDLSTSRPLLWYRGALLLAAVTLLAGCNTTGGAGGDFGEVPRSLARDDTHDWLGNHALSAQRAFPSDFKLTDDERLLRDLAFPLIEPPYDRQQWYSTLQEYGHIGLNFSGDRSDYARRLFSNRYRSPSAQYAQVIDDIRNDMTRLPPFFETATRVSDIDEKRRKSLAYITDIHPKERENALRRIRENAAIIAMVQTRLSHRVAGYRYALERLVVMTPSPQAVDVERTLTQYERQIAHYRAYPAPTWVRERSLAASR